MKKNYISFYLVILSAIIQKTSPILVGVFIYRYYGEYYFERFNYLVVIIGFLSMIVSMGIIPSIYANKNLNSEIKQRHDITISEYLNVSLYVYAIISILLISSSFFIDYLNFNVVEVCLAFFGIHVLSMLVAFSQITKRYYLALLFQCIYIILIFFSVIFSFIYKLPFSLFIKLYLYSFAVAGFLSIFVFYLDENKYIRRLNAIQSIKSIYKKTSRLAIFNIIWMTGVLLIHTHIKENTNDYLSFSIGYYYLSILIFIPSSLSPILIPYFFKSTSNKYIYKIISLWLLLSSAGVFFLNFKGYFTKLIYGDGNFDLKIILLITLCGLIASISTPLVQFLTAKNDTKTLIIGSLFWSLSNYFFISFVSLDSYYYILLTSYIMIFFWYFYNQRRLT